MVISDKIVDTTAQVEKQPYDDDGSKPAGKSMNAKWLRKEQ